MSPKRKNCGSSKLGAGSKFRSARLALEIGSELRALTKGSLRLQLSLQSTTQRLWLSKN